MSKPVFEIEVSGAYWLNCSSAQLTPSADVDFSDWPDGVNRLYSQEYVSALLAELEAKDKRIAELEGIEQKLCAANVTLDARASAAEAKLATPVRLLGEMLPHEWERAERQAAFEHRKIAWDARLAEDKKAILAAGFTFTVEGDE